MASCGSCRLRRFAIGFVVSGGAWWVSTPKRCVFSLSTTATAAAEPQITGGSGGRGERAGISRSRSRTWRRAVPRRCSPTPRSTTSSPRSAPSTPMPGHRTKLPEEEVAAPTLPAEPAWAVMARPSPAASSLGVLESQCPARSGFYRSCQKRIAFILSLISAFDIPVLRISSSVFRTSSFVRQERPVLARCC